MRPASGERIELRRFYKTAFDLATFHSLTQWLPSPIAARRSLYDAGGDLESGALGHLLWLLERHPQLQLTLFVTPDWQRISPIADRFWRHVPWLSDRLSFASVLPKGTMDIRNHPNFVAVLNSMPRTDIALHGLHHINLGRSVSVEFQHQGRAAKQGTTF